MTNKMNKELDKYRSEQESSKISLNASKEAYSNALNGKLGEDIISTLNNPQKASKWQTFKNNFKKALNI